MNFQNNSAPLSAPDLLAGDENPADQRLVSSRIVSVNPFDILCGRGMSNRMLYLLSALHELTHLPFSHGYPISGKTAFTHQGNRR